MEIVARVLNDFSWKTPSRFWISPDICSTGNLKLNPIWLGVLLQGELTDDIFIRMQRCWATPTNNADYDTNFELISDGCGTEQALSQGNISSTRWHHVMYRIRSYKCFIIVSRASMVNLATVKNKKRILDSSKLTHFWPWFKICPFLSMVTRHSVVSELQFSNSFNSPLSGFIVTFKSVLETLVNNNVMAVMQEREEPLVMMFMAQKNGMKGQCWELMCVYEFIFWIIFHGKNWKLAVKIPERSVHSTLLYIELTRSKTLDFTWTIG